MSTIKTDAHQAAEKIKAIAPHFKPRIGIVLGSGLGGFAEQITDPITIQYDTLPGFPRPTVQGHAGKLILGTIHGVDVICLQGRAHRYEYSDHNGVKTYIRTLKLLGCEYFLATNAAGSLCPEVGPGELMLINDHINLQPDNPLIGPNDEEFGPRFYPLDNAYDHHVREQLLQIAKQQNIPLHQGVYLAVVGPHYETAAEIRAFRILGADAVGMSTIPEVLVANHCGMRVAVVSIMTNFATGLSQTSHSHEAVVAMAKQAGLRLNQLLKTFIAELQ